MMSDRHAEFSSAEPDGYREAAALVVSKLAALIPLKDTIAATKNGQTFVDYFASALSAYDKQRALIETQQAALKALDDWWTKEFPGGPDDPKSSTGLIVLSDDTLDIWRTVRAALAATKEQSA